MFFIALACFASSLLTSVRLLLSDWAAAPRQVGSRQKARKRLETCPLSSLHSSSFFPGSPLWDRPRLEPTRVPLCSEVCVLLVPFAWGQALFSVEVLSVYPNVQDLGVSARLSESAGRGESRR